MAITYNTVEGDMLDYICWRHYGQHSQLEAAARQMDPRIYELSPLLADNVTTLGQAAQSDLQGVVEAVLEANPGLANRGPVLPAGVTIVLPDITPQALDSQETHLWDD